MQLKSLNVKDPAQTALMSYNYDYSPAGNVTAKNTEQGNYAYQYDDIYRLTGATNPSVTESFTYDPVGNRLTSIDVHEIGLTIKTTSCSVIMAFLSSMILTAI
jgi:YD repeat-containing protein